jgi:hypothetical protein
MKKLSPVFGKGTRLLVALLSMLAAQSVRGAGPFTVNTTSDTHAISPAASPNDGAGHVSLRSAVEAANAQGGATTINVPAGVYNLTLGELGIAPNGNKTNFISGAGAASTIVNQTDGLNRVFNIDFNSLGGTAVTLSGITIQGGHDGADTLGGAAILAGSVTATPKDVLNVSNCIVQNNHCLASTTQEPGGAIQMAGGDLNITGCTFTNNSSGQSFGGAIFVLSQTVISSLNVTNSTFVNNSMTNNSGAGPDGGGAIMIETPAGSVHNLIGCTFNNNRAIGNSGNTYGGAIQLNVGTLNIGNSTFVTNAASGQGGLGGAIYADSGTVNLSFCRLVGNTATHGGGALYNHGSNGAGTSAANNWWGCNGGPGAAGCDVVASDGGTLTYNPWLIITNNASPATINLGQSTTLTATVLKNSNNQTFTAAQVSVLIGLPLTWNGAVHGSLSGAQTAIQANGQATATFSNDNTCNTGSANAVMDGGVATANVTVQCSDLAVTLTNNVGGTVALGSNWTWTIHVANSGLIPAPFSAGNTLVLDNLPNANATYGSPAIANVSGVTGILVPGIDAASNLTVTASGAVTLNAGGSFDIVFTATPAVTGTYGNPRNGGVCVVDPNNNVPESNEGNNSGTNAVIVTCPTITGTVGGGGGICPGNSAIVTVTVSGGTPPYSVTLNNGGGTKNGTGPFFFTVSPIATTTYQISSGTDAQGCPISNSGSATVTVNSLASPAITLSPVSVLANSSGNQASAPAGFTSYAWTISNGSITGPTNVPAITYVAGASNNVVLGLTVFNASGCSATSSATAPGITGFSVHTNVTFTDALAATTMGLAFDGTNYWSCSGGSPTGVRLARYGLSGALLTTYSPGLDFRSLTTKADGTVLARAVSSSVIYQQTSPGVFVSSGITLTGGTPDPQASVVLNGTGTEFNAMSSGVVSRWSTNGTYLGAVNLIGYGTVNGENVYPQNRGLAAMGNFWLTYNGGSILSIWNTAGNRITQVTLPGAGATFDSSFSFSYCNGKVFIVDIAGGTWRGYDLFSAASVAVLTAETTAAWNSDVTNKIAGVGSLPKVDLFPVTAGFPVPTLAQLRAYQSVMVFSDSTFNDPVAMGNVLADYLDQGGGVVLQTFAFQTSYNLQGRASTGGYLPFTTAAGSPSPAGLTLVKDLPLDPLLDGVSSFTGGSISYHESPISIAPGGTLVAHWSDGQPLVGGKNDGLGRCAGLNFFPPSADSTGFGWVAATDGARLMANALIWSGKIPPTIISAPADQVLPVGATASFKVVATGVSPLSYQWRLNGANLPLATNSTLTFTVLASSPGAYSVVVSNLFGTTTSLNASLNPQLKFLPPVVSGGAFSLFLADTDASPVATNRAARVNIYATTNVALPMASWTLLTNAVVPSGSQLRADGFSVTNGASRFFRAVEAP